MPASFAPGASCAVVLSVVLIACAPEPRSPLDDRGASGRTDQTDAGDVANTPCLTSDDCSSGVCDRGAGRCVACRVSTECPSGQRCEDFVCRDADACAGDLDCTSSGLVCNRDQGHCVACNTAADCSDGPCLGHSCVGSRACESSLECADLRMVCAPAQPPSWPLNYAGKGCAECADAQDCNPSETCNGGLCVEVCKQQGRICGEAQGASCGECPGDAQCAPDGRSCLTVLTTGFFVAERMLAHGNHLFLWAEGRNGGAAVWRIDLDGDHRASLLTGSGSGYIDGLAIAGGQLFVARTNGVLYAGPLGGKLTKFADVPGADVSSNVWCQSLAGHREHVICALVDYKSQVASGLYRIPVDGSPPALFDDTVSQPSGLLVSGDDVVWSNFNSRRVEKSNLRTKQRVELERVQANLQQLAGGYAFYATMAGELRRAPLAGGPPEAVEGHAGSSRRHLVGATDTKLYFVVDATTSTALVETNLDGSQPATIVDSEAFAGQRLLGVHVHSGSLHVVLETSVVRIDR